MGIEDLKAEILGVNDLAIEREIYPYITSL